jgi:uncharacterized membrane protein YbhN (UPF0104 family)
VLATLPRAHGSLLAGAVTLVLANLVVRAARWRLLLGSVAPRGSIVLSTYVLGVAAGLILPASGELARSLLLARRTGLRTPYLLGAAAVEKLLDSVTVLGLAMVGLWAAALLDGWLAPFARAATILLGVGAALGVVVALAPHGAVAPPGWLPARLTRGWERLALAPAEAWGRFAGGVRTVAALPRAAMAVIVGLTLLGWANACLATVLTLAAFDLPPSWIVAAVLYGALLLGLSVPSGPGAVGTFELVAVAVLDALGLPAAPSAAFALGFHVVTFAPPILAGALVWARSGPPRPPAAARPPV